ncbi:MAG: hypothetical protein HOP19_20530, partial [Acidobacteria bacterium]|nr:hypothetical protein [Acidobacteriota bacterium]
IYANFYLNNGALAAKDVRAWLELVKWDRDDALFLVLIGYFSHRQIGQAAEAQQLLELAAQRGDKAAWPYPLLRYLQGEIPASSVLELATNNDRLTEVHGWLGKEALLTGKRAAALKYFRWVKENGNKQFIEYTFSLLELARLEKDAGKVQ